MRVIGRALAVGVCLLSACLTLPVQAADPMPLPAPAGLRITARTPTTVSFAWQPVRNAPAYRLTISRDRTMGGALARRFASASGTVYRLRPATRYYVNIRVLSPRGDERSAASATRQAVTLPALKPVVATTPSPGGVPATPTPSAIPVKLAPSNIPGGLHVVAKTYRSVVIDWAHLPGVGSYRLQLTRSPRLSGGKVFALRPSSMSTLGLLPSRLYYARVRGVDNDDRPVGPWSKPMMFRTTPAPPAPKQPALTVASFNVRCALCYNGMNGEQPWTVRRVAVVRQVISRRPDVIGFQEASQGHLQGTTIPQFIDLRSRLNAAGGAYEITNAVPYNCQRPQTPIGCVPQNRNASQGTRIFYNTKTVSMVSQGSKLLPSCAGCNHRYVAWAILKQKATGTAFFFADIHTQFMPKYADLRRDEVRVMMDEIARRNPAKLPAFVVGDFNSTRYESPRNVPYDTVIEHGFVDPLGHTPKSPAVSPRGTAENRIRANYNSHNNFLRAVARFAEWENGSNIDYIFTTPMRVLLWETVLNVDAHDRIIGTIPSDHNMILIKAALP